MDKSELLHQLRIDRGAEAPRSGARLGIVAAIAGVIALAGASYWWLSGAAAAEVEVEPARALSASAGTGSVLDASGYVTARRQATVSSKVTGKVATVSIEEGMRVEEGQVLATLEDTEARAQFELSRAQLDSAIAQVGEARALATQARREYERQQ